LLSLALSPCALAQTTSPSPAPSAAPAAGASTGTASGPTTVYTLPPDKFEKAKALYSLHGWLRLIGTLWSLVVLLGILYLGVMARYRDWAEKLVKYSFLQAWIVVPLYLLTTGLLDLPLDAYEHSISLRYGLSVQGWASWFGDAGKGFLVGAVLASILLWLMIFIIRKFPRRWWIVFWFPAYAIFLLVMYGAPWIIDPLFNKFEPLQEHNAQLVSQIEKLTARSGLSIPPSRMFLMKASEKTNELNAYVTGFGGSKRIVIWDTTIQKTSTPETLFVVGHEMGHYVLNHVIYGLVLGAAGLFISAICS
jgi:Zn-dependent protease with chaperone function